MGRVVTNLKITNKTDLDNVRAGTLLEADVRSVEIEALVDTGAVMILLPQEVVESLGLPIDGNVTVTLADESRIELRRARRLSLELNGRQMDTDCLVGPPQCEPLVGQLVLERLDLVVDPVRRTVTPRPESPLQPSLKLKPIG